MADDGPPVGGNESRAYVMYAFMGAFFPLAFTAVCLRMYSRWRFNHIGKDDVAIVVAFFIYLGLIIATILAASFGLGMHIWNVPESTAVSMQKCGFTSQVIYPPALGAVKLSILLLYIRSLPVVHVWRNPLKYFAAFVVAEESAMLIALFLQCRPLVYYWDKSTQGSCFDQTVFYYCDASLNIATDLIILSLPWLIFRDLNFSRRKRYGVIALCSMGVFTLIASVLRLPYLLELNRSSDPTWQVVDVVIWSTAELGSAITLSSVPAIKPLAVHLIRLFSWSEVQSNNNNAVALEDSQTSNLSPRKPPSPTPTPREGLTRSEPDIDWAPIP